MKPDVSYLETFYEIVAGFYSNPDSPILHSIENTQGRGGMWEFAESLADEFQEKHKDTEWDGEFYDEIDSFIKEKLY